MITFILSLVSIIIVGIIGNYTPILTKEQSSYLLVSSVLYILLFGFIMRSNTILETIKNNSLYTPLLFYMLWYISSSVLVNLFTGKNNHIGFFEDQNLHMSERKIKP